ncbi:IS21-like element helper ATPase IstB [Clostridium sp. D2Q-11]|uniref:IS21-like element helper ATPase IstB n=1 Tax=Anaeromonas frigoriresistens TaxID=2683708 RepID=A0A942V094_9FIRM|nr:IS21-like element helper ATPase IstB [Anaeromonas frigoriresistens]MBS4537692.1 IS21-like element helper ATPase IstB [Anaeromonas frigoriresistens]
MNNITKDLKTLKLSGVAKTFEIRNEQAIKEKLSYIEFLELLLDDEMSNRKDNSYRKRTVNARFPSIKTLEEYDFNFQPKLNRQEIYNLATGEYIRKKENIVFIGPPGTGKTHLSVSLGVKALQQGYKVLFTSVSEMMESLFEAKADNSYHRKLKYYLTPDLLILDELGFRQLNENIVDLFYEIISKRYETGSVIITSNKPFDDWGSIFHDRILATAILDRIVHHCHLILIKGDSFRMKEQKQRIKQS